jgi:predicted DNA-binding transcriptional regulator YafY
VRAFRLDRILAVSPLEGSFEVPKDFDARDHVEKGGGSPGGVFRADDTVEVTVRYSPRIARWMEEQGVGKKRSDGSLNVRHPVADPGWLVRHVLYHGPDAEVVHPPEIRDLMRQRIAQVITSQEEKEWSEATS